MTTRDAIELIRPAVNGHDGVWVDLGAGSGTFTRALLRLLGPGSRVIAVDRDASALGALARESRVTTVAADFTRAFDLPSANGAKFDGLLAANSLHYVEEPVALLARFRDDLRAGARVVVVEYDRRGPNPWVPFPIPASRWTAIALAAGLNNPEIVTRRPSLYSGDLYVATAERD